MARRARRKKTTAKKKKGKRRSDRPRSTRVAAPRRAEERLMPPVQGVHAYLDDSIREPTAVCAAVVVDAARVDEAEAALKFAKESEGVDPATPIHCRAMFNLEARRTGPWSRFSDDQLRAFVSRVCVSLKRVTLEPLVIVVPTKLKGFLPEHGAPGFQHDAKGAASIAYIMAMGRLRMEYPDATLRIWIDRETTKIPWGRQRRQAQNTRQTILELIPGADLAKVAPEPMTGPRPPLLEVADIYAYVALQVAGARRDALGRWAQNLLAYIQPLQGVYVPPPEGSRLMKDVGRFPPSDHPEETRIIVMPGLPKAGIRTAKKED
jgi:hypothetical protein